MTFSINLQLQQTGLNVIIQKLDKAASPQAKSNAMRELGLLMQRNIVKHTPVKTGGAKNAVTLKSVTATEAIVAGAINYWPPLEDGSKAHVIVPKNAKVLAFQKGSGTVFTKRVHHPGTKGVHAFRDGVKDTEPQVVPVFTKHLGLS